MGQEPSPFDANSGFPGAQAPPGHPADEQPVPVQFSLSTLLAVVAAYALLFGLLRCLGLQSVSAFAAMVIYVTAIALSQWTPLGGQSPYVASFLFSGILSVPVVLIILFSGTGTWEVFPVSLGGFLVMGLFGFLLGGLLDIAMLILEMIGAFSRRRFGFPRGRWPWRSRAPFARPRTWSLRVRLVILALLVVLFWFAVFMIQVEEWLSASRNSY